MQSTPFWPWTACFALCLTGCGRTDFASPEVPSASPSTTSLRVSTLDTFREVGTVPFTGTEHMFFDAAGTLYLVDRETGSINYLDVP